MSIEKITINWETASGNASYNSLVIAELKKQGIDYHYDHFFKLRPHKKIEVEFINKDYKRIDILETEEI